MVDIFKIMLDRFWDCRIACRAWNLAIGVSNSTKARHRPKGPWRPLDWQYGILGRTFFILTTSFQEFIFLLKGVALWTIWVEGDDLTFNSARCDVMKIQHFFRTRSLNYARVLWERTLDRIWIEQPFTTMPLVTLIKFKGEMGFYIIELTLN